MLSVIIPVYNGLTRLNEAYQHLVNMLRELNDKHINDYEIIFVDNNSSDNSWRKINILRKDDKHVIPLQTDKRGIGLALKKGLLNAKGDYVYFTAVDHPFNFKDLDGFLRQIDKYDLIFASKNNPLSVYKVPLKRKLASLILSNIVKVLFNLPLTDTQGTFMVKKAALKKILPFCNSPGPFFQAQLAIAAQRTSLKIGEIPIEYHNNSALSSFSLFRDGLEYICEAVKERLGYRLTNSFNKA